MGSSADAADDIREIAAALQAPASATFDSLPIKDRRLRFKVFKRCFVGREAVDWLMGHPQWSTKYGKSRAEAVCMMQRLVNAGEIEHVLHDRPFLDKYEFYEICAGKAVTPLSSAEATTTVAQGGDELPILKSHGEPRVFSLQHLPTSLPPADNSSNMSNSASPTEARLQAKNDPHAFFRAKLLPSGYVLAQYHRTGRMKLTHYNTAECVDIAHDSPITATCVVLPLILTTHADDCLRLYNVETDSLELFFVSDSKDIPPEQKQRSPLISKPIRLSETRCILFDRTGGRIVCIQNDRLVVFPYDRDEVRVAIERRNFFRSQKLTTNPRDPHELQATMMVKRSGALGDSSGSRSRRHALPPATVISLDRCKPQTGLIFENLTSFVDNTNLIIVCYGSLFVLIDIGIPSWLRTDTKCCTALQSSVVEHFHDAVVLAQGKTGDGGVFLSLKYALNWRPLSRWISHSANGGSSETSTHTHALVIYACSTEGIDMWGLRAFLENDMNRDKENDRASFSTRTSAGELIRMIQFLDPSVAWEPCRLPLTGIRPPNQAIPTCFALDDSFITVGDGRGVVSLFDRHTGKFIHSLNTVRSVDPIECRRARKGTKNVMSITSGRTELKSRVNCLERVGRWVFAGFEDAKFAIFDVNQSDAAEPAATYTHPEPRASIRTLFVDSNILVIGIRPQGAPTALVGALPQILTWSPSLEGFEFISLVRSTASLESRSQAHILPLYLSYTKISIILLDISLIKKIDVLEYVTVLEGVQAVISQILILQHSSRKAHIVQRKHGKKTAVDLSAVFTAVAELQHQLDAFESMVANLLRTESADKIMNSSRLRSDIDRANAEIFCKVNQVSSVISYRLQETDQEIADLAQRHSGNRSIAGSLSVDLSSLGLDELDERELRALDAELEAVQDTAAFQPTATNNEQPRTVSWSAAMAEMSTRSKKYQAAARAQRMSGSPNSPTQYQLWSSPSAPSPIDVSASALMSHTPASRASTSPMQEDIRAGYDTARPVESFWEQNFGQQTMVDSNMLVTAIGRASPASINFSEADSRMLCQMLDNGGIGFVSRVKFDAFLRGFGGEISNPRPDAEAGSAGCSCVIAARHVLSQPWYQGFVTVREAELLLALEPSGSFLVRLSQSSPGSFAIAFRNGERTNQVDHIMVESNMPTSLQVFELETEITRTFPSLDAIIGSYPQILCTPYRSSLPRERWFHGDMSASEAANALSGAPRGTFLVRFSSTGDLAISFVDSNGKLCHSLIRRVRATGRDEPSVSFQITSETGQAITFASVTLLVEHYRRTGVVIEPASVVRSRSHKQE